MKKYFFGIMALAMMVTCSMMMSSCGDKDDDKTAEDKDLTAYCEISDWQESIIDITDGDYDVEQKFCAELLTFFQTKMGTAATVTNGTTRLFFFNYKESGTSAFKTKAKTITESDIKAIAAKYSGIDEFHCVFDSPDGETFLDFTYSAD